MAPTGGGRPTPGPSDDQRDSGTAEMVDFLNAGPPPAPLLPSGSPARSRPGASKDKGRFGGFCGLATRYGPGSPDPWILRKSAVIIGMALGVWFFYVVAGRVCAPMIQRRSSTGFSRGSGAVTLVIFVLFWLMFVWSYLKASLPCSHATVLIAPQIVITGPGFAKKHVSRMPPPNPNTYNSPPGLFVPYSNLNKTNANIPPLGQLHDSMTSDPSGPDPSEFAPVGNVLADLVQTRTSDQPSSSTTLAADHPPDGKANGKLHGKKIPDWRTIERPVPRVEIGPRWCRFCEINKPDRTHHCRHCGTCVMQFDHHCVWIGQCVGWANHKFFIIFNFWAMLSTLYLLIFLCIVTSKSSTIDGQVIGVLAVSALFALFTFMMLSTHIHLILTGRSTVESFKGRDQHDQENAVLQREFGLFWHNAEKRKVSAKWKDEWGGSNVDARWRFGSKFVMWKQEMGPSWPGWIFPIGRPLGDGLHFESNPRFGPNGEWLKRKDWPSGVV